MVARIKLHVDWRCHFDSVCRFGYSHDTARRGAKLCWWHHCFPAIGALVGYVARRFNRLTCGRRLLVALGDLYLATYLFLVAAGLGQIVAQLFKGRAVDLQRSLVVDPLIGTLLGLTYTGFVLALFPLSYLNHVLIGKAWDHARSLTAG